MFGYVKPFKPELKMCEFDMYKAVYCGLCKQLGKTFGLFARFTLSYDFTFIAMLKIGLSDNKPIITPQRCIANPLKKKPCCVSCDDFEYAASVSMLMLYYKLKDDLYDNGIKSKIRAAFLYPLAKYYRNKKLKNYSDIDAYINTMIVSQREIEAKKSTSIDLACEPTAICLSNVLAKMSNDDANIRILERLGYLLGRYIYLADAIDDIKDDIKHNNYNPFVIAYSIDKDNNDKIDNAVLQAKSTLYFTISEIIKTFDLLKLNQFESILNNICYIGLRFSIDSIFNNKYKIND